MKSLGISKAAIAGIVIVIIIAIAVGIWLSIPKVPTPPANVTAPPSVKKEKVLIIGTTDPVVHLDPRKAYEFMSCEVIYNVFDTLVRYDPKTGRYIPWLAEKWEVKDNGTIWIFYLRKDVKFHNGEELTAYDIVYSIKSAVETHTEPSWMLEYVFDINKTKVIDKYTVMFYAKIPSLVLPVLAFTVSAPVPKNVAEELGDQFDLKPVGTGPFKVVEFVPDQYVVLEKFEDYWNKDAAAKVDRIIIKFYKDVAALRMAFEKGEVDVVFRHLRIEDYLDLENKTGIYVIKGEPPFIRYLVIANEKITDKRIRQALAYLLHTIAVPEIVNKIFKGFAKPLYSMVTPSLSFYHKPVFEKYKLASPEEAINKAIELLKEAGYNETHKLKLILGYTIDHYGPLESYVAHTIKEALERTGIIEVEVKGEEWGTYIEHFEKARAFDIFLLGWYPDYLDPDNYLTYFIHSKYDEWTTRYNNSVVDKLLEKAAKEVNPEDRRDLYYRVQDIMAEDVPIIPLWIPIYEYTVVAWDHVKGVELTPSGILWFYKIDVVK